MGDKLLFVAREQIRNVHSFERALIRHELVECFRRSRGRLKGPLGIGRDGNLCDSDTRALRFKLWMTHVLCERPAAGLGPASERGLQFQYERRICCAR